MNSIGLDLQRQEAWDKVTGKARYTDDFVTAGLLHAKICISSQAHAKIKSIDTAKALKFPGVKAILTGQDCTLLIGSVLEDRPPIAIDKDIYPESGSNVADRIKIRKGDLIKGWNASHTVIVHGYKFPSGESIEGQILGSKKPSLKIGVFNAVIVPPGF